MASKNLNRPAYRRLQLESLDQRLTLDGTASAAAALPWFDPAGLTYSFAPDGTDIGGSQSSLFAELSGAGSPQDWQDAFQQAFDEWLAPLGSTIAEVADSGDAFGTFGPTQGDARFGDVRIGAVPLSDNVMAEAVPHSIITQGSWAGDILLNANAEWQDLHQVFSVALHEFGHVLGLNHSDDSASPMFFHGVHDATSPTAADLAVLARLYSGIELEHGADDGADGGDSLGEPGRAWRETPHFRFNAAQAEPLQAVLSNTARYAANGTLTLAAPSMLYKLESIGDIDHAEFLNVVVSATQENGLIPQVAVYDMSGDPLPATVLHNSGGVQVIQVKDVEPGHSYFVAVLPAAGEAQFQVGSFELLAEYSIPRLLPTQVAKLRLDAEHPVAEQKLTVSTSRLMHLMVSSSGKQAARSPTAAVWGSLVDAQGRVVTQLAMLPGDTRSAPLVFLDPGDYRLILETGTSDDSAIAASDLRVFIDEISIDVGPGIVDPTLQPILTCGAPGADAATCKTPTPIILVDGPIFPDPNSLPATPIYPSLPPWHSPSLLYWPSPAVSDLPAAFYQNPTNPWDVSGDNVISPLDVLLLVNALNSGQDVGGSAEYFLDPSGDGVLSPIDALLVVNRLNLQGAGEGEGSVATQAPLSSDAVDPRERRR
jgi:hypothetical protein